MGNYDMRPECSVSDVVLAIHGSPRVQNVDASGDNVVA